MQRSEEEAAALASMPLEAVMSVSYMGDSTASWFAMFVCELLAKRDYKVILCDHCMSQACVVSVVSVVYIRYSWM